MKKFLRFLKDLVSLILSSGGLWVCFYILRNISIIIRNNLSNSRILSVCYIVCLFAISIPLIEKCLKTILEILLRFVNYLRLRLEGIEIIEEELDLKDIPGSWMIKSSCKKPLEDLYEKYANNTSGMPKEFNKGYIEGFKDVMSSIDLKYTTQTETVENLSHEKIEIKGPEDGLEYHILNMINM